MAKSFGSKEAKEKVTEALEILHALGVPHEQQNERSALTLLALSGMTTATRWKEAKSMTLGITEMMEYFRIHFQKTYAPNTRETVRRYTIHQFLQMGLVHANPDNPKRPVNSPRNRYQIDPELLKLLQTYGTKKWNTALREYLSTSAALSRLKPKEREMQLIPVRLHKRKRLVLTPGGQNELIKKIIEEFCPRYTPGAVIIYIGDSGKKHRLYDTAYLKNLGIEIDEHGKMPDVVVHIAKKNWLVLIEAVTSHGPINIKRHNELREIFGKATAGLVFVTAFQTRRVMMKYLNEIAWETEVWIAEAPSHLIHFNGERFLGPYP